VQVLLMHTPQGAGAQALLPQQKAAHVVQVLLMHTPQGAVAQALQFQALTQCKN
jgi:hypothetical protein